MSKMFKLGNVDLKRRIYEFKNFEFRSCTCSFVWTSWTEDGAGRSVAVGVRTITFSDAEEAAEECADEKDEARYSDDESYQVQCTRNTVTVTKTVKNYDIDSYEAYYKAWCENQQRRFKSGDIDKYL